MRFILLLLSLTAFATAQNPIGSQRRPRPNIILLVADDFGVDLMSSYAEGANLPCTPNLEQLSAEGILFRNVWAAPTCSPTRAQVLTGRYGFRTGIGVPVNNNKAGLGLNEVIIPEALIGYDSAAVGKWHLSGSYGITHPNDSGFGYFAGSEDNLGDYWNWTKVTNGQEADTTTYATTDTADEAVNALFTLQEPWFLVTNFNAPHTPIHAPEGALCPPSCQQSECLGINDSSPKWRKGRAMVAAMDHELGRILTALEVVDPEAYVFFIGDNGTGSVLTRPPFDSSRSKGTLYEGGVNVPLVVRGPGVAAGAECHGLVSAVDLYATFAQLARRPSTSEDSVSLVPYFKNPGTTLRQSVYTETFSPNHQASLPFLNHGRTIRDARYKLIRSTGAPDELYDLKVDPWEQTDLVPTLTPGSPEEIAYLSLVAGLQELGVD